MEENGKNWPAESASLAVGVAFSTTFILGFGLAVLYMAADFLTHMSDMEVLMQFKEGLEVVKPYIWPVLGLKNHLVSAANFAIYLGALALISYVAAKITKKLFLLGALIHVALLGLILFTGIKAAASPESNIYNGDVYTTRMIMAGPNGESESFTTKTYCVRKPHKLLAYGIRPNLPTPYSRMETDMGPIDVIQIWRGWDWGQYAGCMYAKPFLLAGTKGEKMKCEISPADSGVYADRVKNEIDSLNLAFMGEESVSGIPCDKWAQEDEARGIELWISSDEGLPHLMKYIIEMPSGHVMKSVVENMDRDVEINMNLFNAPADVQWSEEVREIPVPKAFGAGAEL